MSEGGDVVPFPRRERPRWLRQWPLGLVLAGVLASLILIAVDEFRRGCVVLASSIVLAAFLRLLLTDTEAGMLAVRSRRTDVVVLLVMGVGLAVLSFWVPVPR